MPDRHPHNFTWTEERVAELRKLHAEGLSCSQIARRLKGCTRNAVIGKISRLGMCGRPKASAPARAKSIKAVHQAAASMATIVRNAAARKPDVPLPAPKPGSLEPTATILTLTAHTCRWPIGDPRGEGFGFCGRHKPLDVPYCETHAEVARGTASTQAQRDAARKAREARERSRRVA